MNEKIRNIIREALASRIDDALDVAIPAIVGEQVDKIDIGDVVTDWVRTNKASSTRFAIEDSLERIIDERFSEFDVDEAVRDEVSSDRIDDELIENTRAQLASGRIDVDALLGKAAASVVNDNLGSIERTVIEVAESMCLARWEGMMSTDSIDRS